ncbi:serologically defined colon cancer antigen 8 homolog isoform X2 [Stigmatopora argus]
MQPLESEKEKMEDFDSYAKDLREATSLPKSSSCVRSNQSLLFRRDEEPVKCGEGISTAENEQPAWSQKKQSDAVNQLKSLLLKQGKEIPAPVSPSKDLVPVIHNPPDYIQHLEAEVRFCKEEQQELKERIRVVVVENEKLQDELKAKHSEESPKESHVSPDCLEQLKTIHRAQFDTLEVQVISLRRDLLYSQQECKELTARLKRSEAETTAAPPADGGARVAGLCLKCAQQEAAILPTSAPSDAHAQALDRLTKERNELLAALNAAHSARQEVQHREWSACLQVKGAVEMAEEAHLRRTELEVQCQQLSRELARESAQRERDVQALQDKQAKAREDGRNEGLRQKDELANTVAWLSQRTSELEGLLRRLDTDKSSLTNQLEDVLRQLASVEKDKSKICAELQYQRSSAQIKKEEAEQELQDLKSKTGRQLEKLTREVEKLSSELVGCRQRLEAVQRDGGQWQAEALSLAEQLAEARRQVHLTRENSETAARAHKDKMASAVQAWRERESEMTTQMRRVEAEHLREAAELDQLVTSQNSLIQTLKEECQTLGATLEELMGNKRREVEQLALRNQNLEETVQSMRARCSHMENQCVLHGRVHRTMKNRLQQLDRHCQNSAQQVCELLSKQNQVAATNMQMQS